MSADDTPDAREPGASPQGLPGDPRGKYFRLLAAPRPEEIAAVAGEVAALEAELAHLTELAEASSVGWLAEAQQPQTESTFGPPREAARLARLQSAQAALKLAAALLAVDSPEAAQAAARQAETCDQAIAAWKGSGRGWFESRMIVKGYYAAQLPNEQTGEKDWWWMPLSFGPYRYFRWRAPDPETGALKLRTWYLGKQEAANQDDPTTPTTPGEERPVDQPTQRKRPQFPKRPSRRAGEAPRGGRPAKMTPEEVANIEAWVAAERERQVAKNLLRG